MKNLFSFLLIILFHLLLYGSFYVEFEKDKATFKENSVESNCQNVDVCLSLINKDDYFSVDYISNKPIGGFQFNLDGMIIKNVSGGTSALNGFTMSNSLKTVIGYSLTGGTIPIGNGTLVDVFYERKHKSGYLPHPTSTKAAIVISSCCFIYL